MTEAMLIQARRGAAAEKVCRALDRLVEHYADADGPIGTEFGLAVMMGNARLGIPSPVGLLDEWRKEHA